MKFKVLCIGLLEKKSSLLRVLCAFLCVLCEPPDCVHKGHKGHEGANEKTKARKNH